MRRRLWDEVWGRHRNAGLFTGWVVEEYYSSRWEMARAWKSQQTVPVRRRATTYRHVCGQGLWLGSLSVPEAAASQWLTGIDSQPIDHIIEEYFRRPGRFRVAWVDGWFDGASLRSTPRSLMLRWQFLVSVAKSRPPSLHRSVNRYTSSRVNCIGFLTGRFVNILLWHETRGWG